MSENTNSKKNLGIFSVLSAGILWGMLGIFVRYADSIGLTAAQTGFLRVSLAGILLFLIIFRMDKKELKIRLRDLWMFIGTGVISLTLFSLCYFTVVEENQISIAVTLLYTSPIFVMLMSAVLFHERITKKKVLALAMTFTGCLCVSGIFGGSHHLTARILLIGLASGFFYGTYSIFGKYAVRKYSSKTVTLYTFLFSALAFLPFSNPARLLNAFGGEALLMIFLMAFLCTVLPYLFYTYGLFCMDSGKAAILVTVEPMVGSLIGIVLFHEDHSPLKILGIVLILSASVLLSWGTTSLPKKHQLSE